MTRQTSLSYLIFEFREPVRYFENPEIKFPKPKRKLGQWLGIAEPVGQAMCYYILTDRGTIITQTTDRKLEEPDSMATRPEIKRFDQAVHTVLQPIELTDGKRDWKQDWNRPGITEY